MCGHSIVCLSCFPFVIKLLLIVFLILSFSEAKYSNTTFDHATTCNPCGPTSSYYPSFIRPAENTNIECNLWGPLCQTGIIVVDVNMTKSITPTTVACSYYLSAQAESAAFNTDLENSASYQLSFGRSPECTSYAKAQDDPSPGAWGKLTYSNCGNNASGTLLPPLSYIPIGLDGLGVQELGPALYHYVGPHVDAESCCGSCQFQLDTIRLIYFPTTSQINCTRGQNTTVEPRKVLSGSSGFMKRAHSLEVSASGFVVSNGYTFTSDSIYLEMLGTANVFDHCGTINRVATGTIVALPAYGVSTLSFDIPIGSTILAIAESGGPQILLQSLKSYTKILNTRDLACPTWGFASVSYTVSTVSITDILNKTHAYSGNVTQSIVGPPFNPIILPPKELLSLDPAWARCSDFEFVYNLFDPPRALSAVPAMSSAATSNSPTSDSSIVATSTARPGDTISPNLPINTAKPDIAHPERSSSLTSIVHSDQTPSADSAKTSPSTGPPLLPSPSGPPLDTSTTHSLQDPRPKITTSRPSTTSTHLSTASIGSAGNDLRSSQGIGALIYSGHASSEDPASRTEQPPMVIYTGTTPRLDSSARPPAFATDPKALSPESNPSTPDTIAFSPGGPGAGLSGTPSFTAGGETITVDSTGLLVAGSTILAGGSGVTMSGLPISLGTSGIVMGGSSTLDGASVINGPATSPFTTGGVTFDPNSLGFSVDATKVVSGGSAITVSGKPISLGPSGGLVIDSSTTVLQSVYQPIRNSLSLLTVSGTTLAIEPSGLSLTGTNVITGGSPIMISGTLVSLGSSDELVVGTSTTVLSFAHQSSPASATFAFNDATFTTNPSGLAIDDTSLVAGGSAITVSGTPTTLAPLNKLVGSSTTLLPPIQQTLGPSSTFTINGVTLTANPSGLAIDNTALTAGGAGISVSSIPISLDPSGNLIVGNSTTLLSSIHLLTPSSSTFTINGATIIPNPSGLVIDNTTLVAGESGITVSGTTYSLESVGTLHVGTSEATLPTSEGNGTVAFLGGAPRGVEVSAYTVFLLGTGFMSAIMW